MGNGNTTGLLGVILEVCLDVLVCVVTDDLGGVLVRTNSTITAETQNLHSTVPSADVIGAGLTSGKLKFVTSSTIPIVKRAFGASFSSSLYTANTLEGGVSLEPNP